MNALPALPPAEDEALSQAEAAYRQLRDKLIMLEIRPGEPINDGQLAAELGFGRTPVREAIKRLEVDHLVVSYPRRGTFATTVDFRRGEVFGGDHFQGALLAQELLLHSGVDRGSVSASERVRTSTIISPNVYLISG